MLFQKIIVENLKKFSKFIGYQFDLQESIKKLQKIYFQY